MHNTRIAKRVFAALLAGVLSCSMVFTGTVQCYATTEEVNKDEIVYVITDNDGEVDEIIVNDKLKNQDGSDTIEDQSDLSNIENVKGDEEYKEDGNGSLTWDAEGNEITYQGTSNKELPVDVNISYTLNGKPIKAKDLAGKSGKVTIRFDYTNKEKRKVNVKGKEYEVYVPFTMVSGAILDSEKFSNVEVENGKAIQEGTKIIVFGYAVPGLKDSLSIGKEVLADEDTSDLNLPEYVEISADVKDFELGMTMTAVTNDLLNSIEGDAIDTKKTEEKMDDLEEATDKLVDGSGELNDGMETAYNGSKTLANNMEKLSQGSKKLDAAIGKYTNGVDVLYKKVPTLTSGVSALNTGAAKLAAGATNLKTGTESYVNGVDSLADGLLGDGTDKNPGYLNAVSQLEAGAKQLSGLKGLGDVYSAISLMNAATGTETTYTNEKGQQSATLGYGAGAVVQGLNQIIDNVDKLSQGASGQKLKELAGGLTTANQLVGSASQKIDQAATEAETAQKNVSDAKEEVKTQAENVKTALGQLQNQKSSLEDEISKKNETISEKNSAIKDAQKSANEDINGSIEKTISELKDAKSDLESTKEALKDAKQALKDAETEEQKFDGKISKLEERISSVDNKIDKIQSEINSLEGKKSPVKVVEDSVSKIEKTSVELDTKDIDTSKLEEYANNISVSKVDFTKEKAISQIAASIDAASTSMGSDPLKSLTDGLKEVKSGAQSVSSGVNSLHSNLETLKNKTASFPRAAEGVTALIEGFAKVTKNNGTIKAGATTLKNNGSTLKAGVTEIANGSKELSSGTDSLNTGAKTLSTGVGTLASNNKALNEGIQELSSGAAQLSEGSGKLSDGMDKLLEGTQKLKDGMDEYKEEGISKLTDLYHNDIEGVKDRFEALKEAGKDYQTYTKLSDGQKGRVKFIYKSDEIKEKE